MKTNLNKLSSLSLLAMLGAASGFVASSASAATLVGEWNFDNATDRLANTGSTGDIHDGTGVGTLSYVDADFSTGFDSGQALDISAASSAMRVGNSAIGDTDYDSTFDDLTSFSVSFWVKAAADDSSTGDDAWAGIANKGNPDTPSGWVIRKKSNDNNARVEINGVKTSIGNSFDAAWHHIVMTVDNSTDVSYYFDNGAAITNTVTYSAIATLPMVFGAHNDDGFRSLLNGQLDEIKIYSGVLDATEVSNLYTTNAIPEPGSYALLAGLAGMAFVMARRRI